MEKVHILEDMLEHPMDIQSKVPIYQMDWSKHYLHSSLKHRKEHTPCYYVRSSLVSNSLEKAGWQNQMKVSTVQGMALSRDNLQMGFKAHTLLSLMLTTFFLLQSLSTLLSSNFSRLDAKSTVSGNWLPTKHQKNFVSLFVSQFIIRNNVSNKERVVHMTNEDKMICKNWIGWVWGTKWYIPISLRKSICITNFLFKFDTIIRVLSTFSEYHNLLNI